MGFKSRAVLILVVLIVLLTALYLFFKFDKNPLIDAKNLSLNELAVNDVKSLDLTGDMCFAVFGEIKDNTDYLKKMLNSIEADNEILFVVNNGDFVSQGYTYQYTDFIKSISEFSKPIITVLGNHDIKHNGLANFNRFFGKEFFEFNINDAEFIVLNISETDGNSFSEEQNNWLKGVFNDSNNAKFKFVFFSIPLFGTDKDKDIGLKNKDLATNLVKTFNSKKINYIFSSNISGFLRGNWGNSPFVITGGTDVYTKVCVKGNEIRIEKVNFK